MRGPCSTGKSMSFLFPLLFASVAAVVAAEVKDDHVGPIDALCESVKLPVICDDVKATASDTPVDPCQENPSSCCMGSTCGAFPGMGCWKQRGDTQCAGDALVPFPKIGTCQCKSGYCDNTDGKCKVTATFPGSSAPSYTKFGRLYEDEEKVPNEDHTLVMAVYGLGLLALALPASLALGRRLFRGGATTREVASEELLNEVEEQLE
mmetsp:Transcript_72461/g.169736  ORF Transcript_72461/g.169736 Transcript_72461/m.169736 type:complete len:207 (+) Transcript_72461:31-651(+)